MLGEKATEQKLLKRYYCQGLGSGGGDILVFMRKNLKVIKNSTINEAEKKPSPALLLYSTLGF
jgi:hypothetical protein